MMSIPNFSCLFFELKIYMLLRQVIKMILILVQNASFIIFFLFDRWLARDQFVGYRKQ